MLQLYNSLSQKKEKFLPLSNRKVTMYVCGITPYDTTHLGHAFTYISFDLLIRFLQYSGFNVIYTQNITDINDRDNDILKRANEQNIPWNELATYWTNKFLQDMKELNWVMPTHYLTASKQIDNIIKLIQEIILKGTGYEMNGSVYLNIKKKSDFGKLSRLTYDQMIEKAKSFEENIEDPNKKNPLDITLWKASTSTQPIHIPSFRSPWGKGRPGWHIECSTMSIITLGQQIDIHGGGIDLMYPHHESEIAQSESATGKVPFVTYWLHTGIMRIKEEKMSKSLGNLILVSDMLKKYSANSLRFVFLSHHYREAWNFNENEFIQAEKKLIAIKNFVKKIDNDKKNSGAYKEEMLSYLNDDLNSPKVLQETINILDHAYMDNKKVKNHIKEILTMMGFIL